MLSSLLVVVVVFAVVIIVVVVFIVVVDVLNPSPHILDQVFADFGVFTLMLIHVVKTFASIFLLLVPFILGFAYAFFAILNGTSVLDRFQNESSFFTLIKVQ